MKGTYKGIIVRESLADETVLDDLDIVGYALTGQEGAENRWGIYDVMISEEGIMRISRLMRSGWYAHFWNGREITAVFKGKIFVFDHDDQSSREDVITY